MGDWCFCDVLGWVDGFPFVPCYLDEILYGIEKVLLCAVWVGDSKVEFDFHSCDANLQNPLSSSVFIT